ncbi:MAG: Rho-binding antiterminator [Pseudomonadota bacterium]
MAVTNEPERIDCVHYDYLEVACLYRYDVRVETRDGFTVEGAALDLRMDGNRNEFLVLRAQDREYLVRLSAVSRLEPLEDVAQFSPIVFSDGG